MTETLTNRGRNATGIRAERLFTHAGSASYVQGTGETVYALDVGLGHFDALIPCGTFNNGTALLWPLITISADGLSANIKWFSATATEVGNGDYSTYSCLFQALGY